MCIIIIVLLETNFYYIRLILAGMLLFSCRQKDNVIVSEDSTVLEISEANLINQGTYTCIGINNAGRKEKHFTITITGKYFSSL